MQFRVKYHICSTLLSLNTDVHITCTFHHTFPTSLCDTWLGGGAGSVFVSISTQLKSTLMVLSHRCLPATCPLPNPILGVNLQRQDMPSFNS